MEELITNEKCSVDGCQRPLDCRGLCNVHYQRQWRHKSTDDIRSKPSALEIGHKVCTGPCKLDLPVSEFYVRAKNPKQAVSRHVASRCKACTALRVAELQKLKTPEQKARRRAWFNGRYAELRAQVISAYGGKCSCEGCNVTHPDFLAIDHVNNDGGKLRKQNPHKEDGYVLLCRLIRENYPPEYRLSCHNCNHSRGRPHNKGVCPVHGDYPVMRVDTEEVFPTTRQAALVTLGSEKLMSRIKKAVELECKCGPTFWVRV